jgi:hypothetical protein
LGLLQLSETLNSVPRGPVCQLSMASLSIETLKIHAGVRTKRMLCETDALPAFPSHGSGPKPACHGVNVNVVSAV